MSILALGCRIDHNSCKFRNNGIVVVVQVDCTASEETCKKFGVSGYPTLKIFRAGEFSEEYGGPREAGSFKDDIYFRIHKSLKGLHN